MHVHFGRWISPAAYTSAFRGNLNKIARCDESLIKRGWCCKKISVRKSCADVTIGCRHETLRIDAAADFQERSDKLFKLGCDHCTFIRDCVAAPADII